VAEFARGARPCAPHCLRPTSLRVSFGRRRAAARYLFERLFGQTRASRRPSLTARDSGRGGWGGNGDGRVEIYDGVMFCTSIASFSAVAAPRSPRHVAVRHVHCATENFVTLRRDARREAVPERVRGGERYDHYAKKARSVACSGDCPPRNVASSRFVSKRAARARGAIVEEASGER